MPLGVAEIVVVCRSSDVTASPCPAGFAPVTTNAYLLEPSAQASLEVALGPVDYAQSAQIGGLIVLCGVSLWALLQVFRAGRRAIPTRL